MPLDLDPIRTRLALDNDFRFLARAREDIAALLSEVDSLRAENEGLRVELDKMKTVLQEATDDCDNLLRRLGVDDTDSEK